MKTYTDFSLREFNTFGIEAKAARFIEYDSAEDLNEIRTSLAQPFMVVGRGSNLLLTQDYDGTILHCSNKDVRFHDEEDSDTVFAEVGAGMLWDDLVSLAVGKGLSGIENLSLIPGEVGAAAVQNIGAYGSEARDTIEWVEFMHLSTGEVCRKKASELKYGYRQSIFKQEWKDECAVTRVCFRLGKTFAPKLEYGAIRSKIESLGIDINSGQLTPCVVRDIIIDIRRSKLPDPQEIGNAGSFFMNPIVERCVFERIRQEYPDMPFYEQEQGVKIPAGWLIEQCGWKGKSLGNAGVYEKQALVLVNRGGARGNDIVALSDAIRRDVKKKFGIEIFPEVKFV